MSRIEKALIEFKGTTLSVVAVTLRSLAPDALDAQAGILFGDDRFFDGDAALLDLSQLTDEAHAEWTAIRRLFAKHGLEVIGVRGGNDALREHARHAGLPAFTPIDRPPRQAPAAAEDTAATVSAQPAAVAPAAPTPPEPPAPAPAAAPTRVIDRPLRSGQQVYARGGDLVVLAAVNAGAEVIADGSIHVYAPLRGRALAGASGDVAARIFSTRFEAELVSIAGVYRTFESGVPGDLAGKPAQVRLVESQDSATGKATSTLAIAALKTD
jgi:septum site-determining protein MinC